MPTRAAEQRRQLTELGRSLLMPLALLKAWAEQHIPEVERARAEYDRAQVGA